MKRVYGNNFYYLKFDINKSFYNIDHDIVKSMIKNKIKDKDAINIIERIIDSTDEDYINEKMIKIHEVENISLCKNGKSAPIGSMCFQIIAVMYLDKLNHFIKEKLHIKHYVLYMDDGVLIHQDKEYLKYCMEEISKYLKCLKLSLNIKKTRVDSIKNGLDFLGFRFYIINDKIILKIRNETKRKFKKNMNIVNRLYECDLISYKERKCILDSYIGHLSYGDCSKLIYDYNISNNIELGKFIDVL